MSDLSGLKSYSHMDVCHMAPQVTDGDCSSGETRLPSMVREVP